MAVVRRAEAVWQGDRMSGSGVVSAASSGAFSDLAVSWVARTEQPGGKTSPEEMIAAAHASCFSMALILSARNSRQVPAAGVRRPESTALRLVGLT